MPQQVVGPAALQTRRSDIGHAVDEEPALDVTDPLFAAVDPLDDGQPLLSEPHRVDHTQGQALLLRGGDDPLGAVEVHRDRNLDQGVLAVFQGGQRHLCVGLAGTGDDHDIDLGILQRFTEVGGPFLVAVLFRERRGGRRLAAHCGRRGRFAGRLGRPRPTHDGVQLRVVDAAQRLGMPDPHHAVAHHADIQHRMVPPFRVVVLSRGSGRSARPERRPAPRRCRRTKAFRPAPPAAHRAAAR